MLIEDRDQQVLKFHLVLRSIIITGKHLNLNINISIIKLARKDQQNRKAKAEFLLKMSDKVELTDTVHQTLVIMLSAF